MATQESRHFALSTVSSDLGFNRKTSLFYQGLDSPTFSGALFHPKQSAPDGHPVSVGIYSTDFLDYDPQNTRSHDLDGQFEPTILELHTPPSFTEDHIIDHRFPKTRSASPFKSTSQTELKMTKKRRSLQSIFIPSFLQHSPPLAGSASALAQGNMSRMRSYSSASLSVQCSDSTLRQVETSVISPRNSPPPEFLLDDDPFANLSLAPSRSAAFSTRRTLHPPDPDTPYVIPRSLLSPTDAPGSSKASTSATSVTTPPSPTSLATLMRTQSFGSTLARSAHKKPAFSPRPSLPSLHTLAQVNVVIPKKTRKGRVGGNLPYEPWDTSMGNDTSTASSSYTQGVPTTPSAALCDRGKKNSMADLDPYEDFLDFSEDPMESEPDEASFYTYDIPSLHPNLSVKLDEQELRTPSALSSDQASSLSRSSSSSSTSNSHDSLYLHMTSPRKQGHFYESGVSSNGSVIHPQFPPADSDHDTLNSLPDLGYFSSATSQVDYLSDQDPDLDAPSHHLWSSNSVTPRTSFFAGVGAPDEHELTVECGSSVDTVRHSLHGRSSVQRHSTSSPDGRVEGDGQEEVVDGSDGSHRENGGGYGRDYADSSSGGQDGANRGGAGGDRGGSSGKWNHSTGSGNGGDGGRKGNDGDGGRRSGPSLFSTPLESDDTSSEEDDQASTDDYGGDSTGPPSFPPGGGTGSDDDIPLAQRIPTALRAQLTIRKQVRDERDQRRQERAALRGEQAQDQGPSRQRQQTLRPAAASAGTGQPAVMSSSQEAALHASTSLRRPRTKTLPGNSHSPFTAEGLTQKLLNIEVGDSLPPRKYTEDVQPSPNHAEDTVPPHKRAQDAQPPRKHIEDTSTQSRISNEQPQVRTVLFPTLDRGLRMARSFHRPSGRHLDDKPSVLRSASPKHPLNRSVTTSPSRHHDVPREENRRPSTSGGHESAETTSVPPPRRSLQRPPIPPILPAEALANFHPPATKAQIIQQRIFIGDMQRFNIVEVTPSTNAGEVLRTFKANGALEQVGCGGWMLWEVAQDFGMERPIRGFELLSDITASWNVDKLVNMFVFKVTHLAPLLSRSVIPESSPTHGNWVQWESKRGKWNKRWVQLKEHGLWLSKRETGKDEVFLCSLSTFDAYYVTRLHKAPKPFVFAVKSTENLSLFENTADYVHIFSCNQKDGEAFIEKLLLARSYVLFQERNVLFNKSSGTGASRSGTQKHSATSRPTQPLVQVSAPSTVIPTKTLFEPGSLLAKT